MEWNVAFDAGFAAEFAGFSEPVQDELLSLVGLLRKLGPSLRRPHCDTLNGSKYPNMKELRFTLPDGEWRVAFAFDPERRAILLVGGSKSGTSEKRFYQTLIRVADTRFGRHLETLRSNDGGKK